MQVERKAHIETSLEKLEINFFQVLPFFTLIFWCFGKSSVGERNVIIIFFFCLFS